MEYSKAEQAYRDMLIAKIEAAFDEMSDNQTPTLRLVK